jgi:hypothetical protein
MNVVWGAFYWLLAATLGSIPLIYEGSAALAVLDTNLLTKIHEKQFKDLAIYTLVMTGIGLGDAFEAGRVNMRANGLVSICTWIMFSCLLVILLMVTLNVGEAIAAAHNGGTLASEKAIPLLYLLTALLLAFLAKIACESAKLGGQS